MTSGGSSTRLIITFRSKGTSCGSGPRDAILAMSGRSSYAPLSTHYGLTDDRSIGILISRGGSYRFHLRVEGRRVLRQVGRHLHHFRKHFEGSANNVRLEPQRHHFAPIGRAGRSAEERLDLRKLTSIKLTSERTRHAFAIFGFGYIPELGESRAGESAYRRQLGIEVRLLFREHNAQRFGAGRRRFLGLTVLVLRRWNDCSEIR